MRVYLDLYALQRPLDAPDQPRVRVEAEAVLAVLDLHASDALVLLASGMHRAEIARCPFPDRRTFVHDVLAGAEAVPSGTATVRDRAASYVDHGIGAADAIHLAAAVESGAAFFVTTDDRLRRRGETANTRTTVVVTPLELIAHLSSL